MKMIMKRRLFILLSLVLAVNLCADQVDDYFNKGIAYILIKDAALARKNLNLYFGNNPNPSLKSGFLRLIDGEHSEATHQFRNYLEMNPRSPAALVGIALSTADMTVSNAIELLNRAIRLKRGFSTAYLSLGVQYMKQKNWPLAQKNMNLALGYGKIPEYKVILGELYLLLDQPANVVNLVKAEADRYPENFYFSYLLARAYFQLERLKEGRRYIEATLEVGPRNQQANLLMAKYLLGFNEPKRARLLLRSLKFEEYNAEYVKTFAHVLLKLRDNEVKDYLYEFFAREKWDRDINRLMGLYYLWKKGKGNVQNWINRALLSGDKPEQLQKLFSEEYRFPEYRYLSFFDVQEIAWLSDEIFLAAGMRSSGETGKLYIIDAESLRILRTLTFAGKFQSIFLSEDRQNMILAAVSVENESVNLYALTVKGRNFVLKRVFPHAKAMPSVHVGFNKAGTLAYITDAAISALAFESPFSKVSLLGIKTPVYPIYPFPVYRYNFNTGRAVEISEPDQLKVVPIEAVRKYYLVSDAFQLNEKVRSLIELGQRLDITSTEVVRTYFARDLSSFIIYLSDLDNAFQARIYTARDNKALKIDETMFLGKGNYAELEIIDFDPRTRELLILTKDKSKTLIAFDYDSFLYSRLSSGVWELCRSQDQDTIFVLVERSKQKYFTETGLEVIFLEPFSKRVITSRRDLERIVSCKDGFPIYFSTINGELLTMDEEYAFHYDEPILEDCRWAVSPSGKSKAAFINGRLFVLD